MTTKTRAYDLHMTHADVAMRDAMDKYLNEDIYGGWFSEYSACLIVRKLSQQGDPEAKKVEPVLLSIQTIDKFKDRKNRVTTSLYQQLASTKELENFEKNIATFSNFSANKIQERRDELTTRVAEQLNIYTLAKQNYEQELERIKQGAPQRTSNYALMRGTAFAESNEDPVVLMNKVISDVNRDYPEYEYVASDMNDQVKKLYDNYNTDVAYLNSVHSLITDLSNNLVHNLEKKANLKERQKEVQEYYHKQYEQQIFLVKLIIFFSLFAIVGNLLLHYQLIQANVFAAYLGLIFSVAFVVFFYYLWDFYIRDTTIFDEYEFNTYLSPSNGKVLQSTFKDNIIYC